MCTKMSKNNVPNKFRANMRKVLLEIESVHIVHPNFSSGNMAQRVPRTPMYLKITIKIFSGGGAR